MEEHERGKSMAEVYELFHDRLPVSDPMMWAMEMLDACDLNAYRRRCKTEGKEMDEAELAFFKEVRRESAGVLGQQLMESMYSTTNNPALPEGQIARVLLLLSGIAYAASKANDWQMAARALLTLAFADKWASEI